jgi:hypothetical protein
MRRLILGLALLTAFSTTAQTASSLELVGVMDIGLSGVAGKAVHVRATGAISDLSVYGIGVANNGGGTDGIEYVFPSVAVASGEHILVARDTAAMAAYLSTCISSYAHVFQDDGGGISQNGDDAIELFLDTNVVETYGDINVDGTGQPWEYLDSWAYKDASGNWSTGGLACTSGSTTTFASNCPYPFCSLPPSTNLVTFKVDLTQYTGSFTGAFVNGNFNNWCGSCNPMNDQDNNGIWEAILPIDADSIEYKFTLDGWTVEETFSPGDPCTKTTAGFTNRLTVLLGDTVLAPVCWESCSSCPQMNFPLSLKGIIDFTVPAGGSSGKAIHVYADQSIADLSEFGIGIANNGGGSDGEEYTFPAMSMAAGEHLIVVRDSLEMANYLGACFGSFDHVLVDGAGNINQNGDDAIELYNNGLVIEVFGDVNVDGTGQPWEYLDSWAYKDAMGMWTYGGVDCTDSGSTTFASACPYPFCITTGGVLVTSISVQGQGGANSISVSGGSLQMEASVMPANADNPNVSWSVSPAGLASIDANGLLTAIANGQVTVTAGATDGSGVSGSAQIDLSNQTVGLDDLTSAHINLYPQPAGHALTIKGIEGAFSYKLYHASGRLVMNGNGSGTTTLATDAVASGLYYMDIQVESGYAARKSVLIQHQR